MNLFELLDSLESEKRTKVETVAAALPKEVIYQEHSETAFHPDLVAWREASFMPGLLVGDVLGIIPKDVLGPSEGRKCSMQSPEWKEMQSQWVAYVWAIGGALPKDLRFSTEWLDKVKLFENARDAQQPIRLRIDFTNSKNFRNLEVTEYLSISEGSGSND